VIKNFLLFYCRGWLQYNHLEFIVLLLDDNKASKRDWLHTNDVTRQKNCVGGGKFVTLFPELLDDK
jgi:hypothetical protein